jgi:prevent-host-death family protein
LLCSGIDGHRSPATITTSGYALSVSSAVVRRRDITWAPFMYILIVDVAISDFRAHLSDWLERVRAGQEVVVTDRGVPVARLLGMSATATLDRLQIEGVIAR